MDVLVFLMIMLAVSAIVCVISCALVDYFAQPKCRNHYDCANCDCLGAKANLVGMKFSFYCKIHARRSEKKIYKKIYKMIKRGKAYRYGGY